MLHHDISDDNVIAGIYYLRFFHALSLFIFHILEHFYDFGSSITYTGHSASHFHILDMLSYPFVMRFFIRSYFSMPSGAQAGFIFPPHGFSLEFPRDKFSQLAISSPPAFLLIFISFPSLLPCRSFDFSWPPSSDRYFSGLDMLIILLINDIAWLLNAASPALSFMITGCNGLQPRLPSTYLLSSYGLLCILYAHILPSHRPQPDALEEGFSDYYFCISLATYSLWSKLPHLPSRVTPIMPIPTRRVIMVSILMYLRGDFACSFGFSI